eukprot:2830572-Pyramimonas_sp.AAC.1
MSVRARPRGLARMRSSGSASDHDPRGIARMRPSGYAPEHDPKESHERADTEESHVRASVRARARPKGI